jgi:hypothetical protein
MAVFPAIYKPWWLADSDGAGDGGERRRRDDPSQGDAGH